MRDFIFFILLLSYMYFADKAVYYVKVNLLGLRDEYYTDTINYIGRRAVFAFVMGWAAIPIALIHKNFIANH